MDVCDTLDTYRSVKPVRLWGIGMICGRSAMLMLITCILLGPVCARLASLRCARPIASTPRSPPSPVLRWVGSPLPLPVPPRRLSRSSFPGRTGQDRARRGDREIVEECDLGPAVPTRSADQHSATDRTACLALSPCSHLCAVDRSLVDHSCATVSPADRRPHPRSGSDRSACRFCRCDRSARHGARIRADFRAIAVPEYPTAFDWRRARSHGVISTARIGRGS